MKARGSKATRGHERLRPLACSEPELLRKPLLRTPVYKGNGNLVSGASHTRTRRIWRRGKARCFAS